MFTSTTISPMISTARMTAYGMSVVRDVMASNPRRIIDKHGSIKAYAQDCWGCSAPLSQLVSDHVLEAIS